MKSYISTDLDENKNNLMKIFKSSSDIVFYEFQSDTGVRAFVTYVDGLINKDGLNRDLIKPFVLNARYENIKKSLFASPVNEEKVIEDVVTDILTGNIALFVEHSDTAYLMDIKEWKNRAIDAPDLETVVRGPKEGFVESIRINTSLLRRKIHNSNLVFERIILGRQTKTLVEISYIDGIVDVDILLELKERLNKIDIDSVLESGYIEQYIEDAHFSFLPTVGISQKPDVIAGKLLEGRIAIFCDGTPHVLTVPHLFIENLQSAEDYYMRPFLASLLRVLRFLSFLISITIPSLYVAFQNFHQEMIPTDLLITMAGSREELPFPAAAETLIMLIMLEILRESGTRLPRMIGSAISIVGALVIGQAAVDAGIVSSPLVVVVAVTAITSFISPPLTETMTILRFSFLLLGAFMGFLGLACGIFLVMSNVVSLRSFGVPYTSPLSPFDTSGLKDYMLRFPLWSMKIRPRFIVGKNRKRR